MCDGRLPASRKFSSMASVTACTWRELLAVQIKKNSVNCATSRKSSMTMSAALRSLAARAAIITASSVSSLVGCSRVSSLIALRLIRLLPVQCVLSDVISHARRHLVIKRLAVAHPATYLGCRDIDVHNIGQVNVTGDRPRCRLNATAAQVKEIGGKARRQMRDADRVARSRHRNDIGAVENPRRLAPQIDLFKRIRAHHKEQLRLRAERLAQALHRLKRVRPVGRFKLDGRNLEARLIERCQHGHRVTVISVRDRARILVRWPMRRDDQQLIEIEVADNRARDFEMAIVYRIKGAAINSDASLAHSSTYLVSGC